MSNNIPINPSSTSKRSNDQISKSSPSKNSNAPPTPASPTRTGSSASPSTSPPRKIIAPSVLEKDIIQGDRNAINLSLAHAIAFNDDLQFDTSSLESDKEETASLASAQSSSSINQKSILERLQEAYWKNLQEKLDEEDDWTVILAPIKEIKALIEDLLPKRKITSLHTDLRERIDLELIEKQIDVETFNLGEFQKNICLIIDIMSKVCAPVRDDKIEALRQQLTSCKKSTVCELFNNIYKLLKLMNIDMANFSIKAIRPYIQKQQVEYERGKMNEYLQKHPEKGLEHTKAWLNLAFRKLIDDEEKTNPTNANLDINANISPIGPNKVLDEAFYNLVSDPPAKLERFTYFWPETVLLDREKIMLLHKIYNDLSILSSIIFISNQILSKLKNLSYTVCKNLIKNLKDELFVILEGSNQAENEAIFSQSVTNHVRKHFEKVSKNQEADRDLNSPILEQFFGQITQVVTDKSHKIRAIFRARILTYMKEVCCNTTKNMYRLGNPEDSPTIPRPLLSINQQVAKLASNFTQLVILNKTIHGPFYSKIIKEIYEDYNEEMKKQRAEQAAATKMQTSNDPILFTPRKNNELSNLETDQIGNSVSLVKKKLTFEELDLD